MFYTLVMSSDTRNIFIHSGIINQLKKTYENKQTTKNTGIYVLIIPVWWEVMNFCWLESVVRPLFLLGQLSVKSDF